MANSNNSGEFITGKSSFADVVGKSIDNSSDSLVFPQFYHDVANGKGNCAFIKKIEKKGGKPALIFSDNELSSLADGKGKPVLSRNVQKEGIAH